MWHLFMALWSSALSNQSIRVHSEQLGIMEMINLQHVLCSPCLLLLLARAEEVRVAQSTKLVNAALSHFPLGRALPHLLVVC